MTDSLLQPLLHTMSLSAHTKTLLEQLCELYPEKFSGEQFKQKYPDVFCKHDNCFAYANLKPSIQSNHRMCPIHVSSQCTVIACLKKDGL